MLVWIFSNFFSVLRKLILNVCILDFILCGVDFLLMYNIDVFKDLMLLLVLF